MTPLITLTTDFGDQFAISQLHAVLARDGFGGRLIENHSVTPFSILEGAFEIDALSRFTPDDTIHVGSTLTITGPARPVVATSRTSRHGGGSGERTIGVPVVKTFSDVPGGAPLALFGSNGTLELAVNLGRGDEYFGVQLEDILTIEPLH